MTVNDDKNIIVEKFKKTILVVIAVSLLLIGLVKFLANEDIIPKHFDAILIILISVITGLYIHISIRRINLKMPVRIKQNRSNSIFTVFAIILPLIACLILLGLVNVPPEQVSKFIPVLYGVIGMAVILIVVNLFFSIRNFSKKPELEINNNATQEEIEDVKKGYQRGRKIGLIIVFIYIILFVIFKYILKLF